MGEDLTERIAEHKEADASTRMTINVVAIAARVVLWLIVGLSVGVISATRARSAFDRVSTVGVLAGISMPTFVLGELLILFVFLPLNQHGVTWIQTGYKGLSNGLIPWMGCMILPWITLATVQAAVYTRLSRGSDSLVWMLRREKPLAMNS